MIQRLGKRGGTRLVNPQQLQQAMTQTLTQINLEAAGMGDAGNNNNTNSELPQVVNNNNNSPEMQQLQNAEQ